MGDRAEHQACNGADQRNCCYAGRRIFSGTGHTSLHRREWLCGRGSAYENGQIVESIGGGLCQVSTTLYNAVLYAELEVTRRAPHSMSVSYVEPSRDAMIAEGISDFKFVNNYDTPILIEGYIDGNNQLGFIFTEKIPELQDIP